LISCHDTSYQIALYYTMCVSYSTRMSRNRKEQIPPAVELAEKLRCAARCGGMLRLPPSLVSILMSDPIYEPISALEAEEIRRKCRAVTANDNATSSVTSGSGSGPTAGRGASAGSNVIPMDAASRGASLLLREEAELMRRRKKR
jgi:hypothetical protein